MRAALYLRRSTEEHQLDSLDTQRSEAMRFIGAQGWKLNPSAVFVDDAISRSEFVKRPGLIRAINAAGAGEFDVLVTRDETRLGGDMLRTGLLVQEFIDAGIQLYFYSNGEQVRVDDATQKFLLAAKNFASELEREKTSQRTAEALLVKARQGLNVGGRVYGYDNVEVREGERRRVEYRVNAEQADVVREIYRRFAEGDGVKAICKYLNASGTTSPRATQRGAVEWKTSCIWSMLRNERYRGIILHNRKKKAYRRGTKVRLDRPEGEWLRIEVQDLRIIDEPLWNAVVARMEANRRLRGSSGPKGQAPRHLLSGLARCGVCDGAIQAVLGKVGSQSVKVYVCHKHRTGGNAICRNTLRRPVADIDGAVTDWIARNVLREELVIETMREIRERLAERAATSADDQAALHERARTLRSELQRLGEALIASDDKPRTIVRMLAEREEALTEIEGRLAAAAAAPSAINLESRRMEKEARQRLRDLRGLLERNPDEARRALETLLDGPLRFQPAETPEGRRYEISGKVAVGSLFTTESVPRGSRTVNSGCRKPQSRRRLDRQAPGIPSEPRIPPVPPRPA